MLSFTVIALIVVGVLGYFYLFREKPKGKQAPGPGGLPLLGAIYKINRKNPFLTFTKWAKTYGDWYTMNMGPRQGFVCSDPKWVKELFSDSAFSGRMNPSDVIDMYPGGLNGKFHGINFSFPIAYLCHTEKLKKLGIINSEGKHWEQLRRFTLKNLRDFGFGKSTMESLILEELQEVTNWMKENEGKSVSNMKNKLTLSVVNALWTIVSGHKFKHDDPVLLKVQEFQNQFQKITEKGSLCLILPWTKYVIPEWSGYNQIRRCIEDMKIFYTEAVKEHEESYSEDHQRDFIDCFLKEMKECKDKDSAFFGELGAKQLIAVIADLFQAGSESTSTTLDWIYLYMATFPLEQKKLQQEIDRVVGNNRHVSLQDRPNLPYCESFLAENMRHMTPVAIGVPHRALVDKEFKGYHIPKGTFIMACIDRIHHHPEIWGEDADQFRPERMLDSEGNFKKPEALMPFSIGRRQCAGETLARDTLFLYLCNIFHRFEVRFDPNDPNANPGLESKPGFILTAKPYKIIFKDRLV